MSEAVPRLGERVRTRLLAALVALLAAAIVLASLGWYGMRSAQRALVGFQGELLPNVTQALELAQRTARLAAIAPNVGESRTAANLAENSAAVDALLAEVRRGVDTLGNEGALGPALRTVLTDLTRDMGQLTELTGQRQQVEAQLKLRVAELDRLGEQLPAAGNGPGAAGANAVIALWATMVTSAGGGDAAKIGKLQADAEALWIAARREQAAGLAKPLPPALERSLLDLVFGPQNLLALRRYQLMLEGRIAYLVVLTRGNADQLSSKVDDYVDSLRSQAAERRGQVQQAIRSGEAALLLLALGSVLIAAFAMRHVRRFVSQVETITQAMTRLVGGDTAPLAKRTAAITLRRDELGALARSFEVFRDALLAKQTLVRDLRAQSALLAAVHQSMTDALAVFGRGGELRLWNAGLAELFSAFGVTLHPGQRAHELMQALPADAVWRVPGQPGNPGEASGLLQAHHIELQLPDGRLFDLRSQAMPDGGTVTLVTDLTLRCAIQRQEQHTQRLEVLGQLTGGVAHDFNNYLGTIIGNLDLLEAEATLSAEARPRLQRALRAAASAAGLTRRLLAFARRQPLAAEWVPIDAMVDEMRDLIEFSAGPQTRLRLDLQAPEAQLFVDRGHLENAMLNLVLNSAAAMPEGGELWIATQRLPAGQEGGSETLQIRVTDTGTGIAEHLLGKVFEPFFTTKAPGEGSGLGLSIVYGFVRQSGGEVEVSSRAGEGTCFTLRFPCAAGHGQALLPGAAQAGDAPGGGELQGLSVLVVDDDAAFRETVVDLLRSAGARVQAVADGPAALRAADESALPDVVLTDVCLGGSMDGVQVANALRRRHPALRLCLMSGLAFEAVLPRLDAPEEVGLSPKPFERGALAALLVDTASALH
ncbi:MAG TPA: ATP-binding protein [Ideonella sp.]|uniref:ATP-binding protein n=1 Tax=Ideonella sp. TaxID=1929293 RepID=UPI002CCD98EC|nr:ATP-binding protein [Ideonella sp.]HSI49709.1 ATP-binding protein [Ideonella sp.]